MARPTAIDTDAGLVSYFLVFDDEPADKPDRDPRPAFNVWLADKMAQPQFFNTSGDFLDWIAQHLDDDVVVPLIAEMDRRSTSPGHGFMAKKPGFLNALPPLEERPMATAWRVGTTHPYSRDRILTEVIFATTDAYL